MGEFVRWLSLHLFILLFADDVVLLSWSREGLARLFEAFAAFCKANHLTISQEKTKVMVIRGDGASSM